MKFYSELSRVYDLIFPLDDDTVNFLSENLKSGDRVLDLACGTGEYSIALGKLGASVIGVDLNGDMIKIAEEKAKGLDTSFIETDMTRLLDFQNKKFKLIFCIGNSIVHLNSKNKIGEFIQEIYNNLDNNGVLIIQTINFDRILKYNIDSLPPIERSEEGVNFIRKYNYNKTKEILDFSTELVIKDKLIENRYINSVPLIMLMKDDITSMIKAAGFKNVEFYGGFNKIGYSEESYAMVVKAIK
ncbi:MAG: SAM-dependent methyltransferase [Clostridiales bacterium]|jgi:ubiquinone/menaquinone biosynthesis C-methylase UbiE|nr:SAM-dependent methyltransferase [Clostridiales bacterium]